MEGKDATGMYLASIAKTPLLTAEEEIVLAKQIEAGLYADKLLSRALSADDAAERDQIRPKPRASKDELEELVHIGEAAKDRFVRANLRLVVSLAKKYTHSQLPLLDLIQEGNAGLIRAVEKFDYTKGYKFSTYATWWVRQAVTRGIAQQARIVKLPVHVHEQIQTVLSMRRNLEFKLDREVEPFEIADELDWDVDKVIELLGYARDHVSLDAPLDEESGTSLLDLYEKPEAHRPDDELERNETMAQLDELLSVLSERERDIVMRRFGMRDDHGTKLGDIAAVWGLSSERIRQIEREAMNKLRREAVKRDVEFDWAVAA
ncbi:MAG: sigma-70 family RNA polymerase sigma factor [Propionibacteriaceae bacterium]|jgi:RNA polymerase sigma factor (sigma-70 family)|nr:sigma-70 family RNA polymerase sigma factor [Propionibacteriaceae bacterium]